jgi:hypothetical protein
MQLGGWTTMTKLILAFCNFADMPKKHKHMHVHEGKNPMVENNLKVEL